MYIEITRSREETYRTNQVTGEEGNRSNRFNGEKYTNN
jgi:hypothetical protein